MGPDRFTELLVATSENAGIDLPIVTIQSSFPKLQV